MTSKTFFFLPILVWLLLSDILKTSYQAYLIFEKAMKKTLKIWIWVGGLGGRFSKYFFQFGTNQVTHKNKPPSLVKSGDGYEEDLKIRIWKMTSTTFAIFFQFFLPVCL